MHLLHADKRVSSVFSIQLEVFLLASIEKDKPASVGPRERVYRGVRLEGDGFLLGNATVNDSEHLDGISRHRVAGVLNRPSSVTASGDWLVHNECTSITTVGDQVLDVFK